MAEHVLSVHKVVGSSASVKITKSIKLITSSPSKKAKKTKKQKKPQNPTNKVCKHTAGEEASGLSGASHGLGGGVKGSRRAGFKGYLAVLQGWVGSLCLSSLICKMGITEVSASPGPHGTVGVIPHVAGPGTD